MKTLQIVVAIILGVALASCEDIHQGVEDYSSAASSLYRSRKLMLASGVNCMTVTNTCRSNAKVAILYAESTTFFRAKGWTEIPAGGSGQVCWDFLPLVFVHAEIPNGEETPTPPAPGQLPFQLPSDVDLGMLNGAPVCVSTRDTFNIAITPQTAVFQDEANPASGKGGACKDMGDSYYHGKFYMVFGTAGYTISCS